MRQLKLAADVATKLLDRITVRIQLRKRLEPFIQSVLENRGIDVALGFEIVEQVRFRHARTRCDHVDGGAAKPVSRKHFERCLDDPFAIFELDSCGSCTAIGSGHPLCARQGTWRIDRMVKICDPSLDEQRLDGNWRRSREETGYGLWRAIFESMATVSGTRSWRWQRSAPVWLAATIARPSPMRMPRAESSSSAGARPRVSRWALTRWVPCSLAVKAPTRCASCHGRQSSRHAAHRRQI